MLLVDGFGDALQLGCERGRAHLENRVISAVLAQRSPDRRRLSDDLTGVRAAGDPRQHERPKAVDTPKARFSGCTVEVVGRVF